ncbi:hypothetical protein CVT26_009378 [Gymnopilus dilepis]|uniref:Uncharacterized protein n=1 Tax=Gymnopilus dilepis TaxID=231916 RepID=A0A409VK65_9AGAR|nr:hypothetical protein CVT26_009378 [Gymnopilus dilepis]
MADRTPPLSPARDHYPATSYQVLAWGINMKGNHWLRWRDNDGVFGYQYFNRDGTVYNNINEGEFVTYEVDGQTWYQSGGRWSTNPPAPPANADNEVKSETEVKKEE